MDKAQSINIVYFGTSEFARIILEKLIKSKVYKPSLVVTSEDMPTGRKQILEPSPVKSLALANKISIVQPAKIDTSLLAIVREKKSDIGIVAAYGKIIPQEILDAPKYGMLNIHPSLLPKWRGPSPIQYAILNGDNKTGVTIMQMDEEIDHGPIVTSVEHLLHGDETSEQLSESLAQLSADLLIKTLPKWIAGELKPQEQVHTLASYTKILNKEDGHIVWSKSAIDIERQIRAFTPWPGSFTFWKDKRIKLLKGSPIELSAPKEMIPGQTLLLKEGEFTVQTGAGLFAIQQLQISGKNKMTVKEFLNGYAEIIGATLS